MKCKQLIIAAGAVMMMSLTGCASNITTVAQPGEYCSDKPINQELSGKWQGDDSYYFKFRVDNNKHLCISVMEDNSDTQRATRDIVITDGKLRAFAFYTPSTNGYVLYSGIDAQGDKLNVNWYGTYNHQKGTDVLYKK